MLHLIIIIVVVPVIVCICCPIAIVIIVICCVCIFATNKRKLKLTNKRTLMKSNSVESAGTKFETSYSFLSVDNNTTSPNRGDNKSQSQEVTDSHDQSDKQKLDFNNDSAD